MRILLVVVAFWLGMMWCKIGSAFDYNIIDKTKNPEAWFPASGPFSGAWLLRGLLALRDRLASGAGERASHSITQKPVTLPKILLELQFMVTLLVAFRHS